MKKLLLQITLCLILTVAITHSLFAQTNTWQQKANYGGSARWGSFGFSIGQYGYIGGGYTGSTLSSLWMYDPSNNTWTQKGNMPFNIRTACSFVINNKAYVVGGANNSNTIVGQLWEYNPTNDTWTSKAPYPGTPVYGAAGFAIGSKGYFGIGNSAGATGPYKNEFYEYDPALNSWTQKANFPGPLRYGTFGIAANGLGYVTCGVDENSGSNYNDFWEFNPIANTWTAKANFPGTPRTYPQGFVINGKIFVGTGQDASSQFDDFYYYDQANNTWITKANYGPGNRWLCAGFAINNDGYFGTGLVGSTNQNDFWVYTADTGTVVIPVDSCITIKPNAAVGKDIHIINSLPNFNPDPNPEFLITAWTCSGNLCNDRELIEFDLSSIPTNATLTHAGISLYANPNPATIPTANYGTSNDFYIQRITSTWNEQLVTWNTKPSSVSLNQVTVAQSTSATQNYLDIDVTTLVQDMLNDPANSHGFMFKLVDELTYYNGRDFATSDHADATKWPSITLCYSIPQAVSEIKHQIGFVNVYPNPFNDNFQIELQLKNASDVAITVTDLMGKEIYTKKYFQNASGISINSIQWSDFTSPSSSGIYFLKVVSGDEVITQKIIKTN